MLSETCLRFREDFEPAGPQAHADGCEACRLWAAEVAALGRAGADLPLPPALRGRLGAIRTGSAWPEAFHALQPLPQHPLPPGLLAKLYRIPSEARLSGTRRRAPAKYGDLIAASVFLAAVLTFGLSRSALSTDNPRLASATRIADAVLREAQTQGPQSLLKAGGSILDGCLAANRALDKLLGHLTRPQEAPAAEPQAEPSTPQPPRKENAHGSRPTP